MCRSGWQKRVPSFWVSPPYSFPHRGHQRPGDVEEEVSGDVHSVVSVGKVKPKPCACPVWELPNHTWWGECWSCFFFLSSSSGAITASVYLILPGPACLGWTFNPTPTRRKRRVLEAWASSPCRLSPTFSILCFGSQKISNPKEKKQNPKSPPYLFKCNAPTPLIWTL